MDVENMKRILSRALVEQKREDRKAKRELKYETTK